MSRRLTQAQRRFVNDLREQSFTPSRIARRLRLPIELVRSHLGLPPKRYAALTFADEIEIRRLFDDGVKLDAICEKFKIGERRAIEIRRGLSPVRRALDARAARNPRTPGPDFAVVPGWVPERLADLYLNVAERDGEEAAASACRRLKNGKSVSASRLPAVVSPAGCM